MYIYFAFKKSLRQFLSKMVLSKISIKDSEIL